MIESPLEARALVRLLARYREPNSARGAFELVVTAVPFLAIWALIWIRAVRHRCLFLICTP